MTTMAYTQTELVRLMIANTVDDVASRNWNRIFGNIDGRVGESADSKSDAQIQPSDWNQELRNAYIDLYTPVDFGPLDSQLQLRDSDNSDWLVDWDEYFESEFVPPVQPDWNQGLRDACRGSIKPIEFDSLDNQFQLHDSDNSNRLVCLDEYPELSYGCISPEQFSAATDGVLSSTQSVHSYHGT